VIDTGAAAIRHHSPHRTATFPALASTSMEQGRLAAQHARGEPDRTVGLPQSIGIPKISFVGRTEEELAERRIPFEVGIARYCELARGQVIGELVRHVEAAGVARGLAAAGVHVVGTVRPS